MKKGQIAMLAVKAEGLKLEAEGRQNVIITDFPHGSGVQQSKLAGCSEYLIRDAILVYRYARELVDEVISGTNPELTSRPPDSSYTCSRKNLTPD